MKYRNYILTSVLSAGLLAATGVQGVDHATWGQAKNTEPAPQRQPIDPEFSSQLIGPQGGSFSFASDAGTPDYLKDDLRIQFTIPAHALEQDTEISLHLQGTDFNDGFLEFAPSGLEFIHPAVFTITLGTDWLNLPVDRLKTVLHASHAGEMEILGAKVLELNADYLTVSMEIPGFSRYSLWHGAAKSSKGGLSWKDIIGDFGNVIPNSRYSGGGGW